MTRFTGRAPTLKGVHYKRTAIAAKTKKEKELEEAKVAKEIEKRTKDEVRRVHTMLNGSRRTRKTRDFLSAHFDLTTPDREWKETKPKKVCEKFEAKQKSPKGAVLLRDLRSCVAAPVEISITTKPEVRGRSSYEFDELNLGDLELLADIAAEEE